MARGNVLQTRSVVDAVEDALRDQILLGEVDPGAVITEVGVASEYSVGRPTAKAALDRLVTDGILVRDGRRGLLVRVLSQKDVIDLYEARILLESHAHAALATRRELPEPARQQNEMLRFGAERAEAGVVVASDVAVHRALVMAHGNERVSRMHASLMAEAHVCMARVQAKQLLRAEQIADEHAAILAAIGQGDADAAASLSREHLERARDKLLTNLF